MYNDGGCISDPTDSVKLGTPVQRYSAGQEMPESDLYTAWVIS